jgi:predicted amidohydrolase
MPSTQATLFQKNLKMGLNPLLQAKLGSEKTNFMVFPEYFSMDASIKNHKDAIEASQNGLNWLVELSHSYKGIIIGGSIIREENEKLYNSLPVIFSGQVIDFYNKRNLIGQEKDFLVSGSDGGIFLLNNYRFAVLICGDIFIEEYFTELADEGIRLVFLPVTSPLREDDTPEIQKTRDQELFIERAKKFNLTIVKCAAVGELFDKPLQGRSLVCSPDGITWRMGTDEYDREIVKRCTVVYPQN